MAGVGPRLELRQGQSLVMTPQLQQAIKLLQLSNVELAEYCEAELEKNPLLERDDREGAPVSDAPEAGTESGEGVVLAVDLNTLDHGLVSNDGAELGVLLALHAAQDLAFDKDSESLVQPGV